MFLYLQWRGCLKYTEQEFNLTKYDKIVQVNLNKDFWYTEKAKPPRLSCLKAPNLKFKFCNHDQLGVCSDERLTLGTSAKHHIPQATNIPYQPLLIKPILNVLAHAEKQFFQPGVCMSLLVLMALSHYCVYEKRNVWIVYENSLKIFTRSQCPWIYRIVCILTVFNL